MGSVRPWGYPGRGLLTTPSRGYPQIQPPPQDSCFCQVPPNASNHLQPRTVARVCTPFIDLGGCNTSRPHFYASHPRFWGSQAGHSRAPPGAPCPGAAEERRCPLAARPRPQLAPAWPLHCIFIILIIIFIPWPSQAPGGAALSARWGLQAVAEAVGAGGAQSPQMQNPLPLTPRPGSPEGSTKISPLLTPNGMLLCSLTQQAADHGCSWVQEHSYRKPGAKHQSRAPT